MFCNKCGKELSENAKFCWSCGASIESAPIAEEIVAPQPPVDEIPAIPETPAEPVSEGPVYEEPVWSAPVEPAAQPKKTRKKWIPFAILGGAFAAVAAIVLTMFFTGFFDSPEVKLYKAINKSVKAFAEAGESMGMPDFQYIQDKNAYSTEFAFVLNEVQGNEELRGLGISAALDYSLPDKKLDMILKPTYGSVDLLNVELKIDDNMAYLGSPQITGNRFYSFNTDTLFADLSKLGADVEGMEGVRINVFELLQILSEDTTFTKEDQEKLTQAAEKLIKSIETDKVGTEEISVNGYDLKCDEYEVIFEKEALLEYYEIVMNIMMKSGSTDTLIKLCESLNIPEEMMGNMDLMMPDPTADEFIDVAKEALGEMDDFEMTFYLNNGYVVAVVYELEMDGSAFKYEVNIGGGDNYVDDLSLSITVDGQTLVLESTGNHTGKNGKFTDNTKLSMKGKGFSMTILNSSLSFDSKKSGDNFQWTIKTTSLAAVAFNISGNISYDNKSMTVDLNDIGITQSGEELLAFSLFYGVGEYAESIQVTDSLELLKLSEDEITEEITALGESIEQWAMGMADQIPELLEMIV